MQDWLRDDLALSAGKTVLDLGAGTGKFLPHLRATGAAVIAVEPVPAMRAQLTQRNPGIEAMAGTAEQIPLADGAADAIVCAQAFHWFANPAALAEIHRVLKPGGVLGLIWNVRDESVGWVAALTRIMAPYEAGIPRYHSGEWRRLFPAEGFGPLRERHFPNSHTRPGRAGHRRPHPVGQLHRRFAARGAERCRRGNPEGDRDHARACGKERGRLSL